MVNTSSAGEVSQCPVDSIPIQLVFVGEPYGDAGYGPKISASRLQKDRPLPTFIATVTEHVAARMGGDNLCLDSSYSKERSLLQFVFLTIVNMGDESHTPPSFDVRPSHGCRISSPWIELAIDRKPVPWVRGIVRWNERQFLADQAMLAGVQNVAPGVAKQLTRSEARQVASELRHVISKYGDPLRRHPTGKPIEEIVPTDLLWIIPEIDWGATPLTTSEEAIIEVIKRGVAEDKTVEVYTKLVLALIDRCFDSGGEELHYDSVLDTSDQMFEQYKIAAPFTSKSSEQFMEKMCAKCKEDERLGKRICAKDKWYKDVCGWD